MVSSAAGCAPTASTAACCGPPRWISRTLAPFSHWHALRPRDESGSAALRAVTDTQAQALLLAALPVPEGADLNLVIQQVLPALTNPELIAGVAGVVQIAVGLARQVQSLSVPVGA
jgi:hypothetical protein